MDGPSEVTSSASQGNPEGRCLGRLRAEARVAMIAGAAGSVSLMLFAGRRNESRILLVLFSIWVLLPFLALFLASIASKRWLGLTRAALHYAMLVLALGSVATYGAVVIWPPVSTPAFPFVVVPVASWLLILIVLPMAVLVAAWRSRGDDARAPRRFARLRNVFLMFVMTVSLAVALLPVSLWVEHGLSLELPRPSGPFAVGQVNMTWVDASRVDAFARAPGQKRELVVWIWYPATQSDRSPVVAYLPPALAQACADYSGPALSLLSRDDAKVRGHSLDAPDLAPDGVTYPVIIFRSGIGALALAYTTLVEDLASHGYIVVGADAPYSTCVVALPDGRVIHKSDQGNPGDAAVSESERDHMLEALLPVWTADTRFLLDQVARLNADDPSGKFTGRIDLNSVGIIGHSFGGATAAQFCRDDDRCRAGIDMDGALHGSVVQAGIDKPFLFLLSDHGAALTSPDREIFDEIRSVARHDPANTLMVTLIGADHFSFSDGPLTQSRILRSLLVAFGGQGGLDPRTGLASTTRYVREFFDVHLRGAPREALHAAPLVAGAKFETK